MSDMRAAQLLQSSPAARLAVLCRTGNGSGSSPYSSSRLHTKSWDKHPGSFPYRPGRILGSVQSPARGPSFGQWRLGQLQVAIQVTLISQSKQVPWPTPMRPLVPQTPPSKLVGGTWQQGPTDRTARSQLKALPVTLSCRPEGFIFFISRLPSVGPLVEYDDSEKNCDSGGQKTRLSCDPIIPERLN